MKHVWKVAGTGFALFAMLGIAGQARSQTLLTTGSSVALSTGTTYQYGETTFNFSNCSACGGLELVALLNGRGGTEIEIEEKPIISSSIFTKTSGTGPALASQLAFTLTVGALKGNHGISSITDMVDGSDVVTSGGATSTLYNSYVTSALTGLPGGGAVTSSLWTPSTQSTFTPVTSGGSFAFTATLINDAVNAPNTGYTLKLTDVKLLLNPAPEPASMAVLATGLLGLTAARRRFFRGAKK